MAGKIADPVKEKERKQKLFVAIGGAFLLLLLVVLGPGTWKSLHAKAPQPTVSAAPAAMASVPGVAGSTAPGAAGATAAPSTLVAETAPLPERGQLPGFDRFRGKDPFASRLPQPAKRPRRHGRPKSKRLHKQVKRPAAHRGKRHVPHRKRRARVRKPVVRIPTSAAITVNGVSELVRRAGVFPKTEPLFRVVSFAPRKVKIAIVGGGYEGEEQTLTLHLNKPITLENTADGTRYVLVLTALS